LSRNKRSPTLWDWILSYFDKICHFLIIFCSV
jgi:hypothetical protein